MFVCSQFTARPLRTDRENSWEFLGVPRNFPGYGYPGTVDCADRLFLGARKKSKRPETPPKSRINSDIGQQDRNLYQEINSAVSQRRCGLARKCPCETAFVLLRSRNFGLGSIISRPVGTYFILYFIVGIVPDS